MYVAWVLGPIMNQAHEAQLIRLAQPNEKKSEPSEPTLKAHLLLYN